MTLGRLLKNYDSNLGLKVGSADGNCYFYCGTVGDFLENIKEYSNDIFEYANKKLESENERCRFHVSEFIIIESKDYAKKKVECFIPLNVRRVVDFHLTDKAVEQNDCLVVIIKGSECGKFWIMDDVKDRKLDFNLSYYGTVPDDLQDDE